MKDRGGKIVYGADGLPFFDFLVKSPQYSFGQLLEVVIIYP